jgi:hypothetical protein
MKSVKISKCQHCQIEFVIKPSTRGKFCSLSCGNFYRQIIAKDKRLKEYSKNPKLCPNCLLPILFDNKHNKFCSMSCAAVFNNLHSSPTRKRGPKPKNINELKYNSKICHDCGALMTTRRKFCSGICKRKTNGPKIRKKVEQFCKICDNKFIGVERQTCSDKCKRKALSNGIKRYIAKNPFHKFNRSPVKRSWMETSFEQWLTCRGLKHSLHGYLYEINFSIRPVKDMAEPIMYFQQRN